MRLFSFSYSLIILKSMEKRIRIFILFNLMKRLFHFQGNNNGTKSLVKIINKPSKADHTVSHLRYTPLREIVTTPDSANRKKKNKSTYHWVYQEWRATIPRKESTIVEKARSSWPCRPGYHHAIVQMVQSASLKLLVWGQDLV